MQPIADWLKTLGMSEYAARFAENDVDTSVLRHLTDQDLKELGVSLGHRRKMLAAITELGSAPAAPSAPAPITRAPVPAAATPPPTSAPTTVPDAAGERRYLTVMFCDLVGSTAISAQLDAEEWRDLVGAYLDAASAAVTEMGGHVAKKLGDGLMALFGYPVAHENDAERAARAALSIQRALAEQNRRNEGTGKPLLSARIGLETGPAVVDAAGEIYGDVANIAARVQALAEPGSVLVTARVQRQVAGLFVAEERGTHTLKGVPEPTALFRLVRASGGGRRSGQRNLTPLVGRDDEIAMLLRRWERARQGDGQFMMIVGEPGLGKSRLIEEFHIRLRDTPHTWVEWASSQLLQNTPLHPISEWGRQRFGVADVPAERRLARSRKLAATGRYRSEGERAAFGAAPTSNGRLPYSIPSGDRELAFRFGQDVVVTASSFLACVLWPLGEVDHARRLAEEMVVRAVRGGHIATIAWVRVVHSLFEVMFGNPVRATANVTEAVAVAREHGMKLWMAFGGFLEPWAHSHTDDRDASIKGMLHGIAMLEEQGVWLYGPLLRTALAKAKAEAGQFESALGAIDRAIAETERTGQRWYEAETRRIRGEILLKRHPANTVPAEEAFLTAIAVAQQQKARSFELRAALSLARLYQSTGRAADAHAVLVPALEGFSPTPEFPEIEEAQAFLAALAETDEVKNATASRRRRLHLQTAYANALIHARGHGALETSAAFDKAQALAAGDDDAAERFSAYYGRWAGSLNRGEPATMQETATAFLRETEHRPRSPEAGVAQRIAGLTALYFGNYPEARARIEKALDILDSERDRELAFRFGQDQLAAAMIYLALALWPLGEVERARQFADRAVKQAAKSGNLQTLVYVDYHLCFFETVRGDRQRALPVAQAVLDLAREHAMPIWKALGRFLHGWANWVLGDQQMELAEMRQGIERLHELGQGFYRPYLRGLLAEAHADEGKLDIALAELDDVLTEASTMDQHFSDAELHRIRGEILLKRDPTNTPPAEQAFLTAIAVAQQQRAQSFELRAALSLAKLYQSTGRVAEAHAVLAPALQSFSPTPEFPEIEKAQTLLAALP